jgi:hypothetical protein
MRPDNTLRAAAVFAAAVVGFGTVASAQQQSQPQQPQQQQQQTTPDRTHEQSQQQLEQTKRLEKREMQQDGDRKVEVRERALWALGELPPHLMHKAMEHLADDPREAHKAVMQAANIIELQASLAIQQAETRAVQQQEDRHEPVTGNDRISAREGAATAGGASKTSVPAEADRGVRSYQAASGGNWSDTRDQGLWRAAGELRDLAMRIEYKQVLTKDELRAPFERASVAMASFYQRAAKSGFDRQDLAETGYTLKGAAEYLAAAHAFGQERPTAATSRALFDADRLGEQIIKLSKPTTVGRQNASAENPTNANDQGDTARTAGARQAAAPIPQETGQVIANLGDAIRQAESRQGVAGHSVGEPKDIRNDQERSTDPNRK